MTSYFSEQGIILRAHRLKEADLLVTLLLKEKGKLTAIAKGALKSKRRFLGGLEIFDCGQCELQRTAGKQQLPYLVGFGNRIVWLEIRQHFHKFSLASLFLEVTDTFAHEGDPEAHIFFLPLLSALDALQSSRTREDDSLAAIEFLLTVLRLGGMDPLHNHTELPPILARWWNSPERLDSTRATPSTPILNLGLQFLLSMIQGHSGKKLRSSDALSVMDQG